MLRFVAIVAVLGAFFAALYFSGDALEAWESPESSKASLPAPETKRKAKPKRHAKSATKPARLAASPRKPTWLRELNALCRSGRVELEEIPRPSGPADVVTYLRQTRELNKRLNDQGVELVRRGGNMTAANQLRKLFDQDEAAVQSMLTLAEKGEYQRLARLAQSLVPLARAENRMLARLGAVDCTLAPDEFQL